MAHTLARACAGYGRMGMNPVGSESIRTLARHLHGDVEAAAQHLGRLDAAPVAAHLEMQMRAGRIAGLADQADANALAHRLARMHVDTAQMAV